MNYGSLTSYKLLDGDQAILSDYFKKEAITYRKQGLFSAHYYFNSQERLLRVLNIWLAQESYEKWQGQQTTDLLSSKNYQAELSCQQAFKMAWEMQYSHLQPALSSLHKIQLSDISKQLNLLREMGRQAMAQTTGMSGIWFGRSLTDPRLCLCRIDWTSQADLLNFTINHTLEKQDEELKKIGLSITHLTDNPLENNIPGYIKPASDLFLL